MNEQRITIDGLDIFYMRKPAKYDTRHLLIVFSGFSGNGLPFYNYVNSLANCPADVLWIKDDFYGGESYYLCANGKLDIESRIYKFILMVMNELNLTHENCTVLGGSKGGSAALYYGMKYNFGNIISTVPQLHIGSYVEIDWGYAFKHMVGALSGEGLRTLQDSLDHIIVDEIQRSYKNKNIYLITSLADPQYKTQIENNIHLFRGFNNFNLIFCNSALVTRHNQVNRHIVAITMSIVNLSVMGIPPVFNRNEIKYRETNTEGLRYLQPYASLIKISIENGRFFPEGVGFVHGIPCPNYDDIYMHLVLRSDGISKEIELAKGRTPKTRVDSESGRPTSYDKGWFCTKKYEGIPLDDIPDGEWDLFIKINARGILREIPLRSVEHFDVSGNGDIKTLWFRSGPSEAKMSVSSSKK